MIVRVWRMPIYMDDSEEQEEQEEEKEPAVPPVVEGVPVVEGKERRTYVCDGDSCKLVEGKPYTSYMVTTKPLDGYFGIGGGDADLDMVTTMTSGMRATQRTMNSMGPVKYSNVYEYGSPPDIAREMRRMKATPWDITRDKIGDAFRPVRETLDMYYGTAHHTMHAFRIM